MTQTQHTKWTRGEQVGTKTPMIFTSDGHEVAIISICGRTQAEAEKLADLIAAAPDLLAALKKCEGWLSWLSTEEDSPERKRPTTHGAHIKLAQSAIARAEGRA